MFLQANRRSRQFNVVFTFLPMSRQNVVEHYHKYIHVHVCVRNLNGL